MKEIINKFIKIEEEALLKFDIDRDVSGHKRTVIRINLLLELLKEINNKPN